MSFDDYEIAVKKWSFKFLQGALQNEKKSKLSEILKYNKDTTIKVKFSSVYCSASSVHFSLFSLFAIAHRDN